ncbi:hypothetical protein [Enterococcus rotai]|uniref:hypothetical protein n=1 Tax=Enterococcus rotai TaxID=118060 RepID=UPI0032B36699
MENRLTDYLELMKQTIQLEKECSMIYLRSVVQEHYRVQLNNMEWITLLALAVRDQRIKRSQMCSDQGYETVLSWTGGDEENKNGGNLLVN